MGISCDARHLLRCRRFLRYLTIHDSHHYKQIFGCAMGSPISPVLADFVMVIVVETAVTTGLWSSKMVRGFVMLTTVMLASKRIKSISPTSELNQC